MAESISTLKPSGGDYTSITAWEAAQQSVDWVTATDSPVLECYRGDYTSSGGGVDYIVDGFTITGWTGVNDTFFPTIRAAAGHGFKGLAGDCFQVRSDNGTFFLVNSDLRCDITGIQFSGSAPYVSYNTVLKFYGKAARLDSCLIEFTGLPPNTDYYCLSIRTSVAANVATATNCVIRQEAPNSFSNYGVLTSTEGGGQYAELYNCIFISFGRALYTGSSNNTTFGNLILVGNTANYGSMGGSTVTTAATDKATDTYATVLNVPTTHFRDYAGGDYGISGSAASLIGAGTDYSGIFSEDVYGDTRPVSWSIGIYEPGKTIKHALRSTAAWDLDIAAMEALYGYRGYYSLISTWESSEQRDLVALDETETLQCYNDWPSGLEDSLVLDAWTTDATRNIVVTAPAGERHTGGAKMGFWLKPPSDANCVTLSSGYTVLEFIEVRLVFTNGDRSAITLSSENCLVDSCLIGSESNVAADVKGVYSAYTSYPDNAVTNCIIDFSNVTLATTSNAFYGAHQYFFMGSGAKILNNTVVGCIEAMATGTSGGTGSPLIEATNNVFFDCGIELSGSLVAKAVISESYNATSLSSAPSSLADANSVYNVVAGDFVDAANDDYHLSATSQLIGQGADLSSDFTTDVDGDTRIVPWDIGADQYVNLAASCTLSGTATASITEDDITTGGKTIILTLTNDTWLTAGASFDATRQSIIDSLVSAQSETDGWNNSRSGIAVTDVVRTSDTVCTITLPAL